jgi:hypothetical protein
MSEYEETGVPTSKPLSGWAVGAIAFAGTIMLMMGIFQAIAGLSAIFNDEVFQEVGDYTFKIDLTAWGWLHLILGAIVAVAGVGVITGKLWANVVGIVLAILSAIANFFFIPYQPFWSILLIALAVWIIWALTRPEAVRR